MKTKVTLFLIMSLFSLSLYSTNYVVTTGADNSTTPPSGSLREAITLANASTATPHTITFSGVTSVNLVTAALPIISKSLTIDGGGLVTINGYINSANSIVIANISVTFSNLIFNGAIVSNSGTLTANNCTFTGGTAGILKSAKTLTCNSCTFNGNSSTGVGSAIYGNSVPSSISLNDCIISNNTSTGGAAIYMTGNDASTTLNITNCRIFSNTNSNTSGTSYGGGIGSAANTTIINSEISGNTANRGGGIALLVGGATAKSKLTMTGCTVSGNSLGQYVASARGGGIYIQGTSANYTDNCVFTNCTISGNSTPVIGGTTTTSLGGGVEIGGGANTSWTPTITFDNCTITGNTVKGNTAGNTFSGGGVERSMGTVYFNYCIIAGNNSNNTTTNDRNVSPYSTLWAYSTTGRNMYEGAVSWNGSTSTGNVILTADISTIINTTLTDNGGTTALPNGSFVKTHALIDGCSAINPTSAASGLQTTDQRGIVRSTPDIGAYEYVIYRSKASGNWASTGSWQSGDNSTWSDVTVLPMTNVAGSVTIQNSHEITANTNATSRSITINSGGKLTLNSGSTLSVTGDFSINSDVTNGTGTFVDQNENGGLTVSGTTNVQQYLTSSGTGTAGRNWYISSPLTAATSSTITSATGNGLVYYNVNNASWDNSGTTMEVMKGYIAKSPAQNTTISFTGGNLNTGSQPVSNLPVGFNLVGNPYPSYVNWTEATKSNIANSIWYRSKKSGSYNFHTYNVTGGVGVNDGTDIIPPMQSFWIKATNSTNSLTFNNAMRSHQDQSIETNRLKVPKASTQKLLRLQVSNGTNKDETVLYFNSNAQNSIDEFDSQKMFNNVTDIPEIYTLIGNEKLVVNGMNDVQYDTEIPLGFSTLQASDFSIKVSEFNNFDSNTSIILKDNDQQTEQDLTVGTAYNFESGVTNTSNRFRLIFKTKGTTTGIDSNSKKLSAQVFVNTQNQITIIAPEKCNYAVFNAIGQRQVDGILKSTRESIYKRLNSGIYFVELSTGGQREITKVVIR